MSIIYDAKGQEHFGNGRFIDKLFNKILLEHSVNTEKCDNLEELITITEKDITDNLLNELLYSDTRKNPMGFEMDKVKVK